MNKIVVLEPNKWQATNNTFVCCNFTILTYKNIGL